MKKFFISMLFLAVLAPPMDFTPDTLPHTYCFNNGSCYQGSQSGNDSKVTNIQNPNDSLVQSQAISKVCFGGVCFALDSKGMIK